MKPFIYYIALFFVFSLSVVRGQQTPSPEEKIPFVCTFSKDSDKDWGDDDGVQTFFFVIPESYKKPVYVRIYDPEIGGNTDENHGPFNSKCKFTVYGGNKAHSEPAAKSQDPVGNFRSGISLASKTFSNESSFDNTWYAMGPFNPIEGELQPEIGGRVFKLIIEGMEGDDGNLYKIFLSSDPNDNKPVEGGNTFAYEYTFRLSALDMPVSHLYPFVGTNVTAVKVRIFDFDNDGSIRVVSVAKRGEVSKPVVDKNWMENIYRITKSEINTSLDIQFMKNKTSKNNNIVVAISNQYGELMPFFTTPIGGIPKYMMKIGVKAED
ncbi:MAG: hypothetical protein V4677_05260 [Bacteroidota bacterium]